VLAHVRARFCGEQLNRSVFFKLASLKFKRTSLTQPSNLPDAYYTFTCHPISAWYRAPYCNRRCLCSSRFDIGSARARWVYCTKVLEIANRKFSGHPSSSLSWTFPPWRVGRRNSGEYCKIPGPTPKYYRHSCIEWAPWRQGLLRRIGWRWREKSTGFIMCFSHAHRRTLTDMCGKIGVRGAFASPAQMSLS